MNGMLRLGKVWSLMALLLIVLWPLRVLAGDAPPPSKVHLPPPEKRYPIKNDPSSIRRAYSHSAQWEGRAVAVEGLVKSVKLDGKGRPNIEIALGRDGKTTIWATWPLQKIKGMDRFLHAGEKLRVLGWVRDSAVWAKFTHFSLPRQNPLTLLPICLVDAQTYDALFVSHYAQYCKGWQKGEMPPDLAL